MNAAVLVGQPLQTLVVAVAVAVAVAAAVAAAAAGKRQDVVVVSPFVARVALVAKHIAAVAAAAASPVVAIVVAAAAIDSQSIVCIVQDTFRVVVVELPMLEDVFLFRVTTLAGQPQLLLSCPRLPLLSHLMLHGSPLLRSAWH